MTRCVPKGGMTVLEVWDALFPKIEDGGRANPFKINDYTMGKINEAADRIDEKMHGGGKSKLLGATKYEIGEDVKQAAKYTLSDGCASQVAGNAASAQSVAQQTQMEASIQPQPAPMQDGNVNEAQEQDQHARPVHAGNAVPVGSVDTDDDDVPGENLQIRVGQKAFKDVKTRLEKELQKTSANSAKGGQMVLKLRDAVFPLNEHGKRDNLFDVSPAWMTGINNLCDTIQAKIDQNPNGKGVNGVLSGGRLARTSGSPLSTSN